MSGCWNATGCTDSCRATGFARANCAFSPTAAHYSIEMRDMCSWCSFHPVNRAVAMRISAARKNSKICLRVFVSDRMSSPAIPFACKFSETSANAVPWQYRDAIFTASLAHEGPGYTRLMRGNHVFKSSLRILLFVSSVAVATVLGGVAKESVASPPGASPPPQRATAAAFSPYVDTSMYPAFDLLAASSASGVNHFNLAFIIEGGQCDPKWGGTTDLGQNQTANQIGALRAAGGDVRISFGGEAGIELAQSCGSVADLKAAYEKVITSTGVQSLDFDIEGAAVADQASNTKRNQAIAQIRQDYPGLQVSFTLPVMPEGLTQDGVNLLSDAVRNGVKFNAVNIMTMDYGGGYTGDMGAYATQAATASQAQVAQVLGTSDAWSEIAVTPMIGVNDVAGETFTLDDAATVAGFASSHGLAWTSMWSAGRDQQCPSGMAASPSCSGVPQDPWAFSKAFSAAGRQ
ncbi:hypothetical protein CRH09_13740 [Nocardia terpenica]|uniref:chitinase n=2 Tax=Nocardia terpenica TaxID=455432 RepID=A0A291RIJ0_9NOCA|nr:hypothetical protein CRH09_13740 [Nocardia terpenica]